MRFLSFVGHPELFKGRLLRWCPECLGFIRETKARALERGLIALFCQSGFLEMDVPIQLQPLEEGR